MFSIFSFTTVFEGSYRQYSCSSSIREKIWELIGEKFENRLPVRKTVCWFSMIRRKTYLKRKIRGTISYKLFVMSIRFYMIGSVIFNWFLKALIREIGLKKERYPQCVLIEQIPNRNRRLRRIGSTCLTPLYMISPYSTLDSWTSIMTQ